MSASLWPRTRRIGMIGWGAQIAIAALWLLSSLIDNGSWWVLPFALLWAGCGALGWWRARRAAVLVDEQGLTIRTGLTATHRVPWPEVVAVTGQPDNTFVTQLAVVREDGAVLETPLTKDDERLHECWRQHRTADA